MYKKSRLIILSFDFLLFKMTKEKLIVAIIGQDCREWLNLAIESVEEHADAIVFIDGNPKNPSYESKGKVTVIPREFEHDHKGGIGRARNAYLDYVKKHHMGWYCLVLDADEVVDNIKILKDNIQLPEFNYGGCSVHMRHWIENLKMPNIQRRIIKKENILLLIDYLKSKRIYFIQRQNMQLLNQLNPQVIVITEV